LHMKRPYLGVYEDIFSLGVTLFITVTGYLPFILPMSNDSLYHYISMSDYIISNSKFLIYIKYI